MRRVAGTFWLHIYLASRKHADHDARDSQPILHSALILERTIRDAMQ